MASLLPDLLELFADTVTYQPRTGKDGYNKPVYGAATTYRARVSGPTNMTRVIDNEQRISNVTAWIATTDALSTDGLFTLPARFTPRTPLATAVSQVSDEGGSHHVKVTF